MNHRRATAPSIGAAVKEALSLSMCDVDKTAELLVRDFLAQKFSVAFLKATSPEELERLQALWNEVIGSDPVGGLML